MRPSRRLPLGLLGLLFLAACVPASAPRSAAPPGVSALPHYRAYASADALASALRHGAPGAARFSAHRGGHGEGYPENALETFAHTLHHAPALLETDVHLTRDSVLVLLHDETLDRTTTGTGRLDAHTLADIRALYLRDDAGHVTPMRVPTLDEALAWAEGRAVYTLDVKQDVPPAVLVRAIRRAGAEGRALVITYTAGELAAYLRLAPDLVYSVPAATPAELEAVLAVPGFRPNRAIGFVGVGEVPAGMVEKLHALGMQAMVGVFGEEEKALRQGDASVAARYYRAGIDVIATGAVAEAAALD